MMIHPDTSVAIRLKLAAGLSLALWLSGCAKLRQWYGPFPPPWDPEVEKMMEGLPS